MPADKTRSLEQRARTLLIETASQALALQQEAGHLPAGVNGPWRQPQTAVRTTSHALVMFSEAARLCRDVPERAARYEEHARAAAHAILAADSRPHGALFLNRRTGEPTNGLVGQGWAIEGLIEGYRITNEASFLDVALRVYGAHEFDRNLGLWHNADLSGGRRALCRTVNQQVWFAAIAAELGAVSGQDSVVADSLRALSALGDTMSTTSYAIPDHTFRWRIRHLPRAAGVVAGDLLRTLRPAPRAATRQAALVAAGYASFIAFGLAVAAGVHGVDVVRSACPMVDRLVSKITIDRHEADFMSSPFAISYNPTGIELAFANLAFRGDVDAAGRWLEWQIQEAEPARLAAAQRGEVFVDAETFLVRRYEAARLTRLLLPPG